MDRRAWGYFDWKLLGLVCFVGLVGIVALHSASRGHSGGEDFWVRQIYWLLNGLLVGGLILFISPRLIGRWSYLLHGLGLLALAGLLLKSGHVNRWYTFGGLAVQPSEFVKLTMVLALAYHFRDGERRGLKWLVMPLLIFIPAFWLIVRQPDLGTALILLVIFLLMLLGAGLSRRWLGGLLCLGFLGVVGLVLSFYWGDYRLSARAGERWHAAGASKGLSQTLAELEGRRFYFGTSLRNTMGLPLLHQQQPELWEALREDSFRTYIFYLLKPYQQRRLVAFVNPDSDPLGAGYHVKQSKVAVGSGGFLGKGLGNSTQGALNFLPARHTDFIFAIFAEEWGFLGAMVLLLGYVLMLARGFSIGLHTQDRFGAFTVLGVMGMLTVQMFINTGMAMGLMPVVGIPFPLVSYGGSSMVTSLLGLGLVFNIGMRRFAWD